ncbi:PTS sugar transporter subunit IIA [Breznakia pachnodae]|uniref:PTS system fructose-specific IIA component n=1 Tax=Breznakia pachnodae TaxID=265178 RepID=A0ABU0E0K4_9FIRM|nr:PTS sugar transporter subunit IIA [Breznakia pachnodae]MDQ0360400.1 PTS system fructose-specific IIA component [Breznakia pachnodae]
MLVEREFICLDQEYNNKYEAIKELSKLASDCGKVTNAKDYEHSVLQREAEFTTAIGCLIAMPHGQSEEVKEPFIIFSRSKEDFKWDDLDVQMVLMIGMPKQEYPDKHIEVLSNIAGNLTDEDVRSALLHSNSEKEIFDILHLIEN